MDFVIFGTYSFDLLIVPVNTEALAIEGYVLSVSIVKMKDEFAVRVPMSMSMIMMFIKAIIFVKGEVLRNLSIFVRVELTYIGAFFPLLIIDLTISDLNLLAFPAVELAFEDLPTLTEIVALFKVSIHNQVFLAFMAAGGPQETDVGDGGSKAIGCSSPCELDLVFSDFGHQG